MIRIDVLLRIVLATVFAAAGVMKGLDPSAFAFALARLRLLPAAAIGPAAILIPWMELVAAAALLLPSWRRAGLALAGSQLVAYTVVLAVAFGRGTASGCACFGESEGVLARVDVALARNVLLLAATAFLLFRPSRGPGSPESLPPAR